MCYENDPPSIDDAAKVPANVTLAPLNVAALVVPDLIIRLLYVFVAELHVDTLSLKNISPTSASRTISVFTSNVIVDREAISALVGVVHVLFVIVLYCLLINFQFSNLRVDDYNTKQNK